MIGSGLSNVSLAKQIDDSRSKRLTQCPYTTKRWGSCLAFRADRYTMFVFQHRDGSSVLIFVAAEPSSEDEFVVVNNKVG